MPRLPDHAPAASIGSDPPAWLRRVPLRLDAVVAWGHGRRRMDPTTNVEHGDPVECIALAVAEASERWGIPPPTAQS